MRTEPIDQQLRSSSEINKLSSTDVALMIFSIFSFALCVYFLSLNVFSGNVSIAIQAAITALLFMSTLYSVINAATKR